jgi:hypothetical protein
MVLNKLWIPDVLIDIIKDYLYVNAAEVLRKFYRQHLNSSITDMWVNYYPQTDIYGRDRKIVYVIGHVYGGGNIHLQGTMCSTCGDFDHFHDNMNGCCALQFDIEDEPIYLVDNDLEEPDQVADLAQNAEPETIPEITWDIDIPVANQPADELRQVVLDNWNQAVEDAFQEAIAEALRNPDLSTIHLEEVARQRAENALWGREPENYDYDEDMDSSDQADYAEYMREVEMEAYSNGRR